MAHNDRSLFERYRSSHVDSLDSNGVIAFHHKVRYFERRLLAYLPPQRSAAILDLACGAGEFLYMLGQRGYTNTIGVDVSPEQVAKARAMGITNVLQDDLGSFLLRATGPYDFVLASHVIEHLPKPVALQTLSAVASKMASSGFIVVMTPNAGSLPGLPYAFGDFTHEIFFSATSLAQLAKLAGLEIVHLGGIGPDHKGVNGWVRWLGWQIAKVPLLIFQVDRGMRYWAVEPELIAVLRPGSGPNQPNRVA